MSEMDRILNSKRDKETIYEIYRACRLCGAGAGYKMPIIQNVVDLDDSSDVELKQKIRECVQIEVDQDDKMPPLICELCVDKVNDFYEFLDMCRQTNKRTRLRLGLPPQSLPRGAPDAGDCILGLTEPVYVNDDSDGEPLSKQKKIKDLKVKVKKERESSSDRKVLQVKLEKSPLQSDTRASRYKSRRPPTPPRITRLSKSNMEDNIALSRLQDKTPNPKVSLKPAPKSILKKEKKEDTSLLSPRLKRSRDKEPVKLETPVKKVKIATKPSSPPKSSLKTSPHAGKLSRPSRPAPKRPSPPPTPQYKCLICEQVKTSPQGLSNHLRVHTVGYTNSKLACDPCGEWFLSLEASMSHHKRHKTKSKPYTCRRCTADFKHLSDYDEHFGNNQCISWDLVPDEKCEVCWHLFPTHKLFIEHKCLGEEHRPGGKCVKCNRSYALLKNLKKHEVTCTAKKKGDFTVDPELLSQLKPMQVRVSRCDPLLGNIKQEHYDVSSVTADFGLDKSCIYPYISRVSGLRIKSDPDRLDGMVAIDEDVKDEFCSEGNYVHWDSDSDSDDEVTLIHSPKNKRIDTLATLTLKTLFSQRCLGRVPRKRRRVKIEKEKDVFDSIVDTEDDVSRNIDNIIDNLGNDDYGDDNDDVDGVNDDSKDVSLSDSVNLLEGISNIDQNYIDNDHDSGNDKNNDFDSLKDDANDLVGGSAENGVSTNEIDISGRETNDASRKNGSNNDLSSNNKVSSTDDKVTVNNGTINDLSSDNNDTEVNIKQDLNTNDIKKVENNVIDAYDNDKSDVNDKSETDAREGSETDAKNDDKSDVVLYDDAKNDNESQDSNSIGALSESLLTDNTQGFDNISLNNDNDFNDKCNSHDAKSLTDSIENSSQDSKISESDINVNDFKINDNCIKNDYQDGHEIENIGKTVSVIVNNQKNKNNDSEDDDIRLMAALDAEIGENNVANAKNDKIALEDLITRENNEKTDLNIISDEFNFDN